MTKDHLEIPILGNFGEIKLCIYPALGSSMLFEEEDAVDYGEKLTEIIRNNDIRSVTVVRMEVPCCGGIENAVKTALQDSGKFIPWNVVTIATGGSIIERV